jgi:hypothetical protein
MNLKKGYAFIIDTNEYAGNFERELTAYCTGIIGECEVGKEFVDEEITSIFEENIQQVCDDHGCPRPCEIYPSNSRFNNGMGFNYSIGQEQQAIEKLIESTENYYQPLIKQREDIKIKILGGEEVRGWTIEACDREILGFNNQIKKSKETTKETLGKYPAYESVAIYFNEKPLNELITLMKVRANQFNEVRKTTGRMAQFYKDSNIQILGFRLLEVKQTQTEIEI